MNELLQTALRAASAGAAVVAQAHRTRSFEVREKSRADYVTEVDVAAQRAVTDVILARHPEHAILGEEDAPGEGAGPAGYRWVIDPLDGTTNFIRGIEFFAVSVGLEKDGVPHVAAIVDPVRTDTWHASRGGGAFKNGERIRVSRVASLGGALALTGIPFRDLRWLDRYLPGLDRVARATAGIRRMGSAALDLASIADGRAEVFWEYGLARWDMSAGALLIEEAGGLLTDLSGSPGYLDSGHVLASNSLIHSAFLSLVHDTP